MIEICLMFPVDTARKLNVHKTFRRCPGRLPNVLCTFNLLPVSTVLGEFKCNQHVFVHLFRKKLIFDINSLTKFLSTQMGTHFLLICFKTVCSKVMQEVKSYFLLLELPFSPKIQTF